MKYLKTTVFLLTVLAFTGVGCAKAPTEAERAEAKKIAHTIQVGSFVGVKRDDGKTHVANVLVLKGDQAEVQFRDQSKEVRGQEFLIVFPTSEEVVVGDTVVVGWEDDIVYMAKVLEVNKKAIKVRLENDGNLEVTIPQGKFLKQ